MPSFRRDKLRFVGVDEADGRAVGRLSRVPALEVAGEISVVDGGGEIELLEDVADPSPASRPLRGVGDVGVEGCAAFKPASLPAPLLLGLLFCGGNYPPPDCFVVRFVVHLIGPTSSD